MQEIRKDIPGYEGLYQVSSLGRIKSLDKLKKHSRGNSYFLKKGKILVGRRNNKIYQEVILYKNGIKKVKRVHRLVAQVFLGLDVNNKILCSCHKIETLDNEGFLNNCVDNLWVGTYKENSQDRDIKNRFISWNAIPVIQYSLEGDFIKKWDCIYKTRINYIKDVCEGTRKTAGGFKWKYA